MNNHSLEEIIRKNLNQEPKEIGTVISVFNNIVIADGLINVMMGEKVIFQNEQIGLIFYIGEDLIKILVINECKNISAGDFIYRTKDLFSINIPKNINSFFNKIWEINELIQLNSSDGKNKNIDIVPLGIMERKPVNSPLFTGITLIDALIPIGKGQRQLILGNIGVGKTSIALDMIIQQKFNVKKVFCIYVGIGQKASSIKRVEEILIEKNAMEYTMILTANAADTAPAQYILPYIAVTIGEYLRDLNEDVLIIFDDLSSHAIAYREINLLLKNTPGREAYSGDIFFLHARLLERGGNFLNKGSITMIPILSTYDISSYISTNIISITDGQIYLDNNLFYKGQKPAINIGISVSRLGGAVQPKYMKSVAKSLKIDLSSSEELESFLQFTSDVDENTKKIVEKGRNIKKIFSQKNGETYLLWQQIILLLGVTKFNLTDKKIYEKIFSYIKKNYNNIISEINQDENVENNLKKIEEIIDANTTNTK